MRVGANYLPDRRCQFMVWAPLLKEVSLELVGSSERLIQLEPQPGGYWKGAPRTWKNAITSETIKKEAVLPVGDVLKSFPVAMLVGDEGG